MIAASVNIEKGMSADAIAKSAKERELSGGNVYSDNAFALAKRGRLAEVREILRSRLDLSATQYVPPYNIAMI